MLWCSGVKSKKEEVGVVFGVGESGCRERVFVVYCCACVYVHDGIMTYETRAISLFESPSHLAQCPVIMFGPTNPSAQAETVNLTFWLTFLDANAATDFCYQLPC